MTDDDANVAALIAILLGAPMRPETLIPCVDTGDGETVEWLTVEYFWSVQRPLWDRFTLFFSQAEADHLWRLAFKLQPS